VIMVILDWWSLHIFGKWLKLTSKLDSPFIDNVTGKIEFIIVICSLDHWNQFMPLKLAVIQRNNPQILVWIKLKIVNFKTSIRSSANFHNRLHLANQILWFISLFLLFIEHVRVLRNGQIELFHYLGLLTKRWTIRTVRTLSWCNIWRVYFEALQRIITSSQTRLFFFLKYIRLYWFLNYFFLIISRIFQLWNRLLFFNLEIFSTEITALDKIFYRWRTS